MHVYIEYGLNVPRYVIEGVEQAVPRSGGDLHYLQYVYRWLYYKRDTVLYVGCLYGISFIIIGNMGNNCINFGTRVLQAARPDVEPDNGQVRAIAITAAAVACVIHGVSRRGGILLNNLLALIKVGILLIIVGTTLAVVGGGIKDSKGNEIPNVFGQNLNPKAAFKPPTINPGPPGALNNHIRDGTANGYAAGFLSIIFAYSGFEQNNFVLGEIARPRKTFPRASSFAVLLVSILYMVTNVCYMAVVPAHEQSTDVIALLFFRKTFDFAGPGTADRIFNSFLALASFGNIIVMTYTASRMKQEIAKQGFLPFAKFLGQNSDLSIGRFIIYLRNKGVNLPRWMRPEQHQEATPIGALTLHLASSVLLILATYRMTPADAYEFLSGLAAYVTSVLFGFFLALGILILRIWGPPETEPAKTEEYRKAFNPNHPGDNTGFGQDPGDGFIAKRTWREMTGRSVKPWLSVLCAVIYLVGNGFPLVVSWYPATAEFTTGMVQWWLVPAVSFIILGFASAWWLGFLGVARYREHHQQKNLIYEVRPEFAWADPIREDDSGSDSEGFESTRAQRRQMEGGKILVHETVLFSWIGGEMHDFDMDHVATGRGVTDYDHHLGQGGRGARLQRRGGGRESQVHQQPYPPQTFSSPPPPPPPPPPPVNEFSGTDFADFGPSPPPAVASLGTQRRDVDDEWYGGTERPHGREY